MLTLRPYQERLFADVRAALRAGHRSILVQLPTGGGKTVLLATVATSHLAAPPTNRVLIVVHRRELVRQTVAKLRAVGLDRTGVLQGDSGPGDVDARLVVASVQTLLARGERPPATLVIHDEAHHVAADGWRALTDAYADAVHLGFTATPIRSDGRALGDMFRAIVCGPSVREMIALRALVSCDVLAPPSPSELLWMAPLVAYQHHAAGRRALVFCASIEHARAVAGEFSDAGVPARCVDADTPADERDQALAAFARGDCPVLTNVFCFTEGFDCPAVEVCILARGCSNAGTYLQMVGRVVRPSPGKSRALLIDLRGATYDCGFPDEDRVWSLDGAPCRRVERIPTLQRCDACLALFRPSSRCPRCGADLRSGKSVRIPRTLTRAEKLERISGLPQAERDARYLKSLVHVAKTRVMPRAPLAVQQAWVLKTFQQRFGRAPEARVQ